MFKYILQQYYNLSKMTSILSRISKSKFFRGSVLTVSASFLGSFINYLLNRNIGKAFSIEDYGEYSSALSYLVIISVPLMAQSMIIIRRIGMSKNRTEMACKINYYLKSRVRIHFLKLVVISVFLIATMIFFGKIKLSSSIFVIALTYLAIFSTMYLSILNGYQRFDKAAFYSAATNLIKFVICSITILIINKLYGLYISLFLIVFLVNIQIRKSVLPDCSYKKNHFKFKPLKHYLLSKELLIPFIANLGMLGLLNTDMILVKKFFPGNDSGLYAGLSLFAKIVFYVCGPIASIAYTFYTRKGKTQKKRILMLASSITIFFGIGALVSYTVFPKLVISIIFNSKYASLAPFLWLSAIFGAFYSLINIMSQFLIAKNSKWVGVSVVAGVLQFIIISIYHPSFYSAMIVNSIIAIITFFVFLSIVLIDLRRDASV